MDEDGYTYIVQRKKDMIIVDGFNVYPSEVEGVLYTHPGGSHGRRSSACRTPITARSSRRASCRASRACRSTSCRRTARPNLAAYKVPRRDRAARSLPQSAVGQRSCIACCGTRLAADRAAGQAGSDARRRARTQLAARDAPASIRIGPCPVLDLSLSVSSRSSRSPRGALRPGHRQDVASARAPTPGRAGNRRSHRRRRAPGSRDRGRARAIRGATTLICAISERAALLPTVSMSCAARSVSSRA